MKFDTGIRIFLIHLFTAVIFSACSNSGPQKDREVIVAEHSQELNEWLESRFFDDLARSPMTTTIVGKRNNYDRLDDFSALSISENNALAESWLDEIRNQFDPDRLSSSARLSHQLYVHHLEDRIASHSFADHEYIFQHLSGPHSSLISFMTNHHSIQSVKDAEDYIVRLNAFENFMNGYIDRADLQIESGITLPGFVYPIVKEDVLKILTGHPFTETGNSPLWSDFTAKVEKLEIPDIEKTELKRAAQKALLERVGPALNNVLDMIDRHHPFVVEGDGVWRHPKGEAYYRNRLLHHTTTDMTPEEIHELGLSEVARIKDEMLTLASSVEFEGDLSELFDHLKTSADFRYSDTQADRDSYLAESTTTLENIKPKIEELFHTIPQTDIIVKAVEPYRESSALKAFYSSGANVENSAVFYVNLSDMVALPKYQLQAIAYHEGIPGHHMLSRYSEIAPDMPYFRRLRGHTVFLEGWAFYAEQLPSEIGLYQDPYQDLGRLSLELFRAGRLVVDTGIHHKKWTREEAVQYLLENTPTPENEIRREVDRYIVWPGQATSYMIGMLKIRELRKKSEDRLGSKFDIRDFHEIILSNGSVPLGILEELIEEWLSSKIN